MPSAYFVSDYAAVSRLLNPRKQVGSAERIDIRPDRPAYVGAEVSTPACSRLTT
jgi:hypothetical protein